MAHYRAMNGAWSFALYDYYNEGLTPYLTEPVCTDRGGLFDIEDLYSQCLVYENCLTLC